VQREGLLLNLLDPECIAIRAKPLRRQSKMEGKIIKIEIEDKVKGTEM
jgi:hypothetical protein